MSSDDAPICGRCAAIMTYAGRISLPPLVIHRCEACGNQTWAASSRRPQVKADQQQQPQQQQQLQPDTKKKE